MEKFRKPEMNWSVYLAWGKTANVVMGDAFGEPAFAVDTHVERVSKRLNL